MKGYAYSYAGSPLAAQRPLTEEGTCSMNLPDVPLIKKLVEKFDDEKLAKFYRNRLAGLNVYRDELERRGIKETLNTNAGPTTRVCRFLSVDLVKTETKVTVL